MDLRRGRKLVAVVVALSLAAAGCTTQGQRIGSGAGDPCFQNLKALDATGNYFGEDVFKGAVIGAIGGALLGGLIGGDAKSAAIGAGAGAVAGGGAGYLASQQQQAQDKQVLYQQTLTQYEKELQTIDEADLAFKKLTDCRNATLRQISADYKARTISRDDAVVRWRGVLDLKARDLQIAQNMGKDMTKHLSEFNQRNDDISKTPWDKDQEARIRQEQEEAKRRHAQELAELRRQQQAQQAELQRQQIAAQEKAARRQQLLAQQQADQQAQQQKQAEEDQALAQKRAGRVPTSTAQTHIQSYNSDVQVAQQSLQKQQAVASNPDGFEAAL